MHRRDFLRFLRKPALAVVAVPVVAAAATAPRESNEPAATAKLRRQVAALKDRIDRMDRNYKRALKAAAAIGALLLGIDLSLAL